MPKSSTLFTDEAPKVCKFCKTGGPTYKSAYRDAIEFDCGTQVLYHEPPHGKGWSWWVPSKACPLIEQAKNLTYPPGTRVAYQKVVWDEMGFPKMTDVTALIEGLLAEAER